jgi:hypothetical protein
MWCNQIFSLINECEVKNIIVCDNYDVANQIAKLQFGDDAYAVDTTQYPLSISDKYIDGIFYRGEKVIERNLTPEEEVAMLKSENAIIVNQYAELAVDSDYRLSLLELGLV